MDLHSLIAVSAWTFWSFSLRVDASVPPSVAEASELADAPAYPT